MADLTRAQRIEFFHLAFLEVLSKRLDPSRYVLKGGANLCYFFGSVRYSEDVDIDLARPLPADLETKVGGILGSRPLALLLRAGGLEVSGFTAPKQTETTRRWKVSVAGSGEEARTKIEFSGRENDGGYRLDRLPMEVAGRYGLPAPSVQHYGVETATAQKVRALAARSETQARDVFDLDLLLRRRAIPAGELDAELLTQAAERAFELPFDAYRDQVLAFIEPDVLELYDGAEAWERMQTAVAGHLEAAR
ncbi:MAG: nucleotidyl transferase AbiEii/AbiGii toxin family protein [Solirubrobacterales bacterium]